MKGQLKWSKIIRTVRKTPQSSTELVPLRQYSRILSCGRHQLAVVEYVIDNFWRFQDDVGARVTTTNYAQEIGIVDDWFGPFPLET
jgi:hypothetical protein